MGRSPIFDGVNPRLLAAIKRVGDSYGPYGVRIISAYRPGSGQSQHGRGNALDVELYDKKTGEKLPNYQNAKNVKEYQEFAHAVYADVQKNDPELAKQMRWGGYFGNDPATGKPKYGSLDLMHFDAAGDRIGMRGGSFEKGFTPEMQKYWGIPAIGTSGGGAGSAVAATPVQSGGGASMPAALPPSPSREAAVDPAKAAALAAGGGMTAATKGTPSPEQMKRALLATIAKGESSGYGYDMMLGGGKISDFSKHPGVLNNSPYGSSTAAGKYQFLKSTWDEEAKKYGYKDFSPETQDTAAWNYARDRYNQKTGRSLEVDLASGDPKILNDVSKVLSASWTSLPGGPQPNSNWKGKDFASVYNENYGSSTDPNDPATQLANSEKAKSTEVASYADPTPNVGSGSSDYSAADTAVADAGGGKAIDWGAGIGDIFSGMGKAMGSSKPLPSTPATIAMPHPTPQGPVPTIDPKTVEAQRQMLAMALQRLNSGRLV